MLKRLPRVLNELNSSTIGAVIILGGTNDLAARDYTADETIDNIIELHRIVHSYSHQQHSSNTSLIYTIAVTIPESGWGLDEKKRLFINRAIRRYADSCPGKFDIFAFLYLHDV